MTFQDLGLCPQILSALRDMGYEKPSPIQEKAIPPALKGRDVLGCAQTGTGKTCAFAAPILQRLNARKPEPFHGVRPIRALILTPTRELALQIQESFVAYGKNLPLRSAVIFGGVGQQPQVDALKRGVDILVATPGRLEDLHNQGFIHVEKLEIFVLDEADRMLDMGFIHDVKKILTWLPQKKQTLFFSATMPPEVQHLVDSLLVDPVKVAVDPVSSPVEIIDQRLFYVDRANKSKLLAMLVKHPDVKNALVFTRTKHGANKVAADLAKAGIPAAAIHGNKSQTARQQALADFKAGRIKALVATDIAARGLDIEELSHVFNYNLPDVPETYVHRIGRTGRAGHGGTAVSFCEFGEKELLAPIEKLLKKPIPVVEGHPFPMENFDAPKRDKHGKIVNADDDEARQAARERKQQRQQAASAKKVPVGRDDPSRRPAPKTPPVGRDDSSRRPAPKTPPVGRDAPARHPSPVGAIHESPVPTGKPSVGRGLAPAAPAKKPSPKEEKSPDQDAAFEAWLAEERRIQAQQGYAAEEIMDSTARLLAPKGEHSRIGELGPERGRAQGRLRPGDQSESEGKRPGHAANASQTRLSPRVHPQTTPKTPKNGAKTPENRVKPTPKTTSPKKGNKQSQPTAPQSFHVEHPQSLPKQKAPSPKQEKPSPKRDPRRSDRPRRAPLEPLRPNAQKDSTEQRSLMKPYYFNPNED